MSKPPLDSTAPNGWTNLPSGDTNNIKNCADLLTNSTFTSGINNNANPSFFQSNIVHGRTALWLRDDGLVTVAFHSLDGPTDHPGRHPKFCVCAGIDQSLTPVNPPNDPTYQSIQSAVNSFVERNQHKARIYVWVEGQNQPVAGDFIYPVFQYAINNEIASSEGESPGGVPEDYSHQPGKGRWPKNITTWKLKKVHHA
jgi:hypothetical protein